MPWRMAWQSSILAWRIPWTEFIRSLRVGHVWSNLAHTHACTYIEHVAYICSKLSIIRKMQIKVLYIQFSSLQSLSHVWLFQFSSVAQSCPTLGDPMNRSTPGLPVHQQLPEVTQTHVHRVGDAIQPSHPLSSSSLPAFNLSQHQGLFQWVNSSHEVAKVLEFQKLQHQSFQWTPRTDLL